MLSKALKEFAENPFRIDFVPPNLNTSYIDQNSSLELTGENDIDLPGDDSVAMSQDISFGGGESETSLNFSESD
jgi:hypothetical protein